MWDYADIYKKDQFAFSYCTVHEMMYKKLEGRKLSHFFEWNGYETSALCCLSSLGLLYLEWAKEEGVSPEFAIDKRPPEVFERADIQVIAPRDIQAAPEVDVYIIAHVYYFNEIADSLIEQGVPEERIVSLNDILFSI